MSEIPRASPLIDCKRLDQSTVAPARAQIRLGERAGAGMINLRGSLQVSGFAAATANVLGAELPDTPNTRVGAGDSLVCWLGPDEWLVLTPPQGEADLIAALRRELASVHAAVTDVTGGHAVITVAGPAVRQVLAKGCTLDLHPKVFAPGRCARSLLAKAGVLLIARDDGVDVIVARSFADYLWGWLIDASEADGLAVV